MMFVPQWVSTALLRGQLHPDVVPQWVSTALLRGQLHPDVVPQWVSTALLRGQLHPDEPIFWTAKVNRNQCTERLIPAWLQNDQNELIHCMIEPHVRFGVEASGTATELTLPEGSASVMT
jgi:hypothetical protein